MKKVSFRNIFICIIILGVFTSCSSMDEYYADYIAGAEKIFPGKADSVRIYPGNERAMVSTQLSSDPKVVKLLIYWNNKQDSLILPVAKSEIGQTKKIIITPLKEGNYNFELLTYDDENNPSLSTEGFVRVYGEKYISSLSNRIISKSGFNANNVAYINWVPVNSKTLIGTKISYANQDNDQIEIFMGKNEKTILLTNYKPGGIIQYTSSFLPEEMAIDTFYTSVKSIVIQ